MEKENNNKLLIIIAVVLAVIAVCLGGVIIYKSSKLKENNINESMKNKNSYVGNYKAYVKHDYNEDLYMYLYLRDDGTFRFNDGVEANAPYVGTYEIKDEKIIMQTVVAYGSDNCFYKDKEFMKTITLNINDDGSLKYVDTSENSINEGKEFIFKIDNNIKENDNDLKYYSILPKVGDENELIDCTGKLINEYAHVFKEDGNTVIDYDLQTNIFEVDYETAYNLVIKESSSLKKKSNVNIFNYVGRVNKLGDSKLEYISYDVNFYNLPNDIYTKSVDAIKEDKLTKVANCMNDCKLSITPAYKELNKYFVKNAFYYYVFSDGKKIETRDALNKSYIINAIPDEWLKLGNYKSKDAMYKDVLLITDESHNYKNYLVVYDTGKELKIKYKGKSKTILNKDNYNNINRLYDLNYVSSDKSAYVGGYKAQTDIIDGKPFYVYMYLRSDGTYTYGNNTASGARNVGTYEIKDRKILLHDIVSYGSDACYFTDESYLFDITMTIKDGITLYDEKSKETFSKDSSIKESSYEIARYVTNPIDGKKPTQDDDEWLHCNADGSLVNPKYE